jgi:hypothetical protein
MRETGITRRAELCRRHRSLGWMARSAAVAGAGAACLLGLVTSCLDRPLGAPDPVTTNLFVDRIRQTAVDKLDLLFMIDNSASMSDKQAILQQAVPDLVNRLVNPPCIDAQGRAFVPAAAGDSCPVGQSREFNPVSDIHVAIVSSSLGDGGANSLCQGGDSLDSAHLIGSLQRGRTPTAEERGFLAWRPGVDAARFNADFQRMVAAVGEQGCGFEASLESWYRFLIDPWPYAGLERVKCRESDATPDCVRRTLDAEGRVQVDGEILAQRAAFLRPDSLVAIVMLSDENDCSLRVGGQSWIVGRSGARMFRGSSACDANPNDPCCYTCGGSVPDGCAADPACAAQPGVHEANHLSSAEDGVNMRCFAQKQRYGTDFLYPTERYVNALKKPTLCWSRPDLEPEGCPEATVPNPLFERGRAPDLVFLGGIVGVPWQSIAHDAEPNGSADAELVYKTAKELGASDWQALLGTPGSAERAPGLPGNPFMIESTEPRAGVTAGNAINGREYDTAQRDPVGVPNDLQYACISPLPEARACAAGDETCDCSAGFDSPLCEREPHRDRSGATQYWAKAYPGTRQLEVLRGFGENSIVASICARNVSDAARSDYGYRPAISALVDRLKEKLGDRCLPRPLEPAADGSVPCTLIEARPDTPACECDPARARKAPTASVRARVVEQLRNEAVSCGTADPTCADACICEVLQVNQVPGQDAAALERCQLDPEPAGVEGWCYVADSDEQSIGDPELVARCPETAKRALRFTGQGLAKGSVTFISCAGSSLVSNTLQ